MADNITEEELRLKAKAKLNLKNKTPSWSDVVMQAPVKAAAGVVDAIANTPENLGNLVTAGNQLFQAGMAPESYYPADAPEVTTPDNTTTNYLAGQGFIDPNMRENMTPGQKIVDTGIQGATGALFGGGASAMAKNALVGGLSNATGEAVTQGTGSEALGLTTAMLSPVGASKISALNKVRDETQALNALRDKTNQEAQSLGFVVVPDGKVAQFAERPKLLEAAVGINRRRTADVARSVLGIPPNVPLETKVLDKLRFGAYQQGYEPLKKMGRVTTDNDYLDDLSRIEQEYTGAAGSFPDDVPPKLRELVDSYFVSDFDSGDVIDKIKVLRRRATKNINSDDPTNNEYGFAQQKIAEAMEGQLERSAAQMGADPAIMDTYKKARKLIATSHTVGAALNSADGTVDMYKLAKMFDKGNYMEGDLLKVAKFASINKPKINQSQENRRTQFAHLAGASAGYAVARAMDLPEWTGPLLAMGGYKAGEIVHGALSAPVRKYLTSKTGQARTGEDYASLGIDPRQGALSGLSFENAQGAQ